jgi:hypothetical protein
VAIGLQNITRAAGTRVITRVVDAGGEARRIWHSGEVGPCADRVAGRIRPPLSAGRAGVTGLDGVRTLSLILNFVCTPNLNYREITALGHVSFLGETVTVA